MPTVPSQTGDRGSHLVQDRLANLDAIVKRMIGSLDGWADSLHDHPEAATMIGRLRTIATSAQERSGSVPDSALPMASDAVRQVAEVAFAAAFACEVAYQTGRLAGDFDACDLLESRLNDYAAVATDARRLLPHVVARELRGIGVTCACPCPMCSLGLCGCVRATLAVTELGWVGEEPARTDGLVLVGPPRPGSQLAEAWLEEGDRVLTVGGDPVGSNGDAQSAIRRHELGGEMRIEVARRDGSRIEVTARRVA